MSYIKDNQMNLLSQLAYVDLPDRVNDKDLKGANYTVSDMVDYYLKNELMLNELSGRCAMDQEEWRDTLLRIKNDPELCKLKISGYENQNQPGRSGLVAFCLETENREAIIAYRGSETRVGLSTKDWEDNFQTGFTDSTDQQKAALVFLDAMKKKYNYAGFETTGHSKGGNNAQYVAIMSDDVKRCVSFDAPCFCNDFLINKLPEILKGKDKIVAYEGKLDITSSLLFSIAGKTIIIDTEEQAEFLYNHKPNLFLDENGDFYKETDKSVICTAVRTYTTRVSTLLPDWAGLYLVDSVFNMLDGKFSLKEVGGLTIGILALPFLVKNALVELSFLGGYHAGKVAIEYVAKKLEEFQNAMSRIANEILDELKNVYKNIVQLKDMVFSSVTAFFGELRKGIEIFYTNCFGFVNEPYLHVNVSRLMYYANRLDAIGRQVSDINRRIENLYYHTDLLDLINLFKADLLTEYNSKLNKCIRYLYNSIDMLENTENRLVRQANSL